MIQFKRLETNKIMFPRCKGHLTTAADIEDDTYNEARRPATHIQLYAARQL